MLQIPCPYCGLRPETEFRYAGEAHLTRPLDPDSTSDDDWTAYLYYRTNPRGSHRERWRHLHGCGRFFNVVRHTVSDIIEQSYQSGTLPAEPPS